MHSSDQGKQAQNQLHAVMSMTQHIHTTTRRIKSLTGREWCNIFVFLNCLISCDCVVINHRKIIYNQHTTMPGLI